MTFANFNRRNRLLYNVLLLENNAMICQQVQETLQSPQFRVIPTNRQQQACEAAKAQQIHLVVLGTDVPNAEGIMEELRQVPGMGEVPLVLFLSGPNHVMNWNRMGKSKFCYLSYSGFSNRELCAYVNRLLGID